MRHNCHSQKIMMRDKSKMIRSRSLGSLKPRKPYCKRTLSIIGQLRVKLSRFASLDVRRTSTQASATVSLTLSIVRSILTMRNSHWMRWSRVSLPGWASWILSMGSLRNGERIRPSKRLHISKIISQNKRRIKDRTQWVRRSKESQLRRFYLILLTHCSEKVMILSKTTRMMTSRLW